MTIPTKEELSDMIRQHMNEFRGTASQAADYAAGKIVGRLENRETHGTGEADANEGLFSKYAIEKSDGSAIDADACYFVLHLDTQEAARKAMRAYVEHCDNEQLADDITRCLDWLDESPACICGGGRDMDVICPFHDGGFFGHAVWRHGG